MNNELTAALFTIEKCREMTNCPAGVDLQDWVKQLAAESLTLKAGIREALEEMESHHDTDGLYSYDADGEQMDALIRLCDAQGTISDLLSMVETPATDRIVAEAEARGVEKFAAEQRGVAERLKKRGGDAVTSSVKFCISSAEEAEDFAKQLREGADK
ncbi:hypothetical protein OHS39_000356 [Klebsiella aerogenes]|nr:hypothetical protein [Klebsiella aerogenes]